MKKNNTAEKNLLEAQALANALKEGTQKTLNQLLNEALEDFIEKDEEETTEDEPTETDGEETTVKDDSFDVEDVTTDVETDDDVESEEDDEESSSETEEDDEWSKKLDDYKVGDNDFDLTNVDDDTAFEIFSKIGDSDLVHIQKQEDGTYEINDENSGAELVLDLNPDGEKDGEAETTDDEEDIELDVDFDSEEEDTDGDIELDDDSEEEFEIDLGDEEELNENLGYTDDYQKDVMPGLNVKEPAKKDATYSMDGGVPTDAKKPWAGKHTEPDYKETGTDLAESVEDGEADLEECGAARTSVKKSHVVKGNKEKPEGFPARGPQATINEEKLNKMIALTKAILEENKKYKKSIEVIKQGLLEAYVTNVNYGRLVNILMNETTSKEEKRSIVERFKGVKTLSEGKTLTESIKRELNSSHKNKTIKLDEQISANSSKTINETVMFEQSSKNNSVLSLMERMERLPELNGVKKTKR